MEGDLGDADDLKVDLDKAVTFDEIRFDPFFEDHGGNNDDTTTTSAPFPCTLQWDDLRFGVGTKSGCCKKSDNYKEILHGMSGIVRPTELLAIMGSSGAGKTTLLNMLAGRLTSSSNATTEGSILLNGEKRNFGKFKRLAAYVEQDDNMFAEMTVREQIEFSANLRLPREYSEEKKKARVDKILGELGLAEVQDTYIGSALVRGISGGQRKRVNIGTELVTEPSLIFLDEPTSGLDAFNALMVMRTLGKLAQAGRTVVTTIHQPRSNIFTLFDKLILLSEGRVMYFGPATDAVAYFSGLRFPCPSQFNPADFFIDLLSVDSRTVESIERTKKRIAYLGACSDEKQRMEVDDTKTAPDDSGTVSLRKYASSYPMELCQLLVRQFKTVTRERAANRARLGQVIIFALLLGLIWINVGRDFYADENLEGLNAIMGVIFFICINQTVGGVFSVVFVYPTEKAVVMRERASGSYRVSAYLLSKTLIEIPRTAAFVTLFVTIAYWMIGLMPTARAFLLTLLAIFGTTACAESMAVVISTITPNPQVAVAIAPVFIIIMLLFAGFFIPDELIPVWLRWIQYLSFIKYAFGAVAQLQFEGTSFEQFVIDTYGNISIPVSFVVLYSMWFAIRFIAYIVLRLKGPKYDRKL